ncbi:hypothetical protein PUN28_014511 [Cardiocondyla obscurior]|uniref:Uncharacterized protein n=1 Tax=Cardiocondyla obscurior TaxID=286306 RepID=A0AAW2F5J0_9HYME
MWPRIVGIFSPINSSRLYQIIPIETEYFINQDNYFYLILLHTYVSLCVSLMIILTFSTIIIMTVKYICGMLSIASYRIENAMAINIQQNISKEKLNRICEGIICAVDIHRKAVGLVCI